MGAEVFLFSPVGLLVIAITIRDIIYTLDAELTMASYHDSPLIR